MPRLSIRLLGPFQMTLDGEPVTDFRSDKVRALLVYLSVETAGPHRREKLAGLLWPDLPEQSARANLRYALSNLRQLIGDHQAKLPFLHVSRQTIQFNSESGVRIDVTAFTDLLEAGLFRQRTIPQLEEAVALYRGGFLEGFSVDSSLFEEWALLRRERLHRLVVDALQRLAECHEERGEYERALRYTWQEVGLDPWRERAYRQLIRLLALNDQRGTAIAQYEAYRSMLAEELGIEPAAETTRLYEQVRDGKVNVPEVPLTRLPDIDISVRLPLFLDKKAPLKVKRPVFVGREREIERMNELFETALGGKGQVIFVTGDAGRGKTALLDEFARRALDAHPDLLLATGNCNAYSGVGDPYLPFRDVMAMFTGDVEARWTAGDITRNHARRLWETLPDAAQMLVDRGPELIDIFLPGRELATRVAAAAPGKMDWSIRLEELTRRGKVESGSLDQSHLFEQYTNVLLGLAAQRPLVIVLDDLQWADMASVSLLFHLGKRIDGSRILVAGAYRPDEIALGRDGERHPLETLLAEFKRCFGDVWVDLARTEEAEARRFVDAFLDAEPNRLGKGFRRALFRRTAGHPLFTIELLRAMQERGDLVQDERGRWVEGPALDWETLPVRVEGVIEERIGRLKLGLREMLSVASVEGEEFTAQVVARVQQVDERELLWKLSQELEKRHRLVRELGEVQVGDRHLSRYRFSHVLFQQYLYNDLGAGVQRLLHREVASALEELYEDQPEEIGLLAPQLALHYAGDREREQYYARLAGERAAAQFANTEAVRYLSRALKLTPEGNVIERYNLLLTREEVFGLQGARESQKQDLMALADLVDALNDDGEQITTQRAEIVLRQSQYANVIGDYPAAITAAQEAIRLSQAAQDASGEVAGYLEWGRALWRQGDYDAARIQLEQALALAQAAGLRQVEVNCLYNLDTIAWYQGRSFETRASLERGLRICREIGDRIGEGRMLNGLGRNAIEQGDLAEARSFFERVLQITREIGDRRGQANALSNLGWVSITLGDYVAAREYLEQALHVSSEIRDQGRKSENLNFLGLLYHHLGDDQTSWEHSQQGLQIANKIGDRDLQGRALCNLGHALVAMERSGEAAESYQQSLELRRETGQEQLAMESLAGLARASMAQGELSLAQARVEEILSHLERRGLAGAEDPIRIYLTCYRILHANQDPRAQDVLIATHDLLQERAANIDDEELRRSFLEDVATHREIISLREHTSQFSRSHTMTEFTIGELIENRYRVLDVIGIGGMGTLYCVSDEARLDEAKDGEVIALKTVRLKGSAAEAAESVGRFQREFQLLTQLRHPNLVSVYDYGVTTEGELYFTMEWVGGGDLNPILHRLEPGATVPVIVQVCRALAYLHARGVIHGDLKPHNVLLTGKADANGDQIKLVDFGVAHEVRSPEDRARYYTPGYAAPETRQPQPIDHRTDLYSLGAMWYALLVGEAPMFMPGAGKERLIRFALDEALAAQRQIPAAMGAVIARLMATSPADRYGSANEVIEAVNEVTGSAYELETRETAGSYALRTRFVNRETEFETLQTLWEQAQESEGKLVLVSGEGGVGKTRLVEELEVRAELEGARVVWGQCVERGGSAYHPWREVLRVLMRYVEGINEARRKMQQVGPVLATMLPELWERDYMQALAPPVDLAPQAAQQRLNNSIVQVLRAAAGLRPTLIVIEDAHWADEATLALLGFLARVPGQAGLLVCVTYRSDEIGPDHPLALLASERLQRIPMQTLPAEVTTDMVRLMLGLEELPTILTERVQQTTGGNAFFVQELIRSLAVEGKVLQRTVEGWQIDRKALEEARLPESIRQVVWRRLEHLSPDGRRVLNWAAVMGMVFWERGLAEVGRTPWQRVRVALREGVAQGLIEERDESAFEGEREYLFNSSIVREMSYESIPQEERRDYHSRVAAWLMAQSDEEADEHLGLIADHLEGAGQTEQAVIYLTRAGEQAAAQFAHAEALGYFGRALDLTPADAWAERYSLLLAREKVYDLQGAREAQAQNLTMLQRSASALDDDAQPGAVGSRRAEAALRQSRYAEITGDYPAAIAAAQESIRLSQAAQDVSGEAAGYLGWGRTLMRQGDFEAALTQLEQGLALAQAASLRQAEVDGLRNLGLASYYHGVYARAMAYSKQALPICRELGDRWGEGAALNDLGLISRKQGDYAEARAYYEQALYIIREIGERRGEGYVFNNLSEVVLDQGNYTEAQACLEQALYILREVGDRQGESESLGNLGLLFHHLGDDETARKHSQQAEQIAQEIGDRYLQSVALTRLGHALAGLGRLAGAADVYQQALVLRQKLGQTNLAMESLAGLARVSLAQGDLAQAQTHVEKILSHLEHDIPATGPSAKDGTSASGQRSGHGLDGTDEPLRVYLTCYRVLRANQNPRAEDVLSTAHALLQERVANIDDEELRRSFLEDVPAHREIVCEWEK